MLPSRTAWTGNCGRRRSEERRSHHYGNNWSPLPVMDGIGSSTEYVARLARCLVLTVKPCATGQIQEIDARLFEAPSSVRRNLMLPCRKASESLKLPFQSIYCAGDHPQAEIPRINSTDGSPKVAD